MRVLELYAGIGGLAAALAPAAGAEVVAAVDVSRLALGVYGHNFPHPRLAAAVESLAGDRLRHLDADLWWLSPPCQPFTRRGLGRDLDDPRAATFLAVLDRIAEVRPPYVALENVPPFRRSRACRRLHRTLGEAGYHSLHETVLCPTELGLANRRRRYYLVASRHHRLVPVTPAPGTPAPRPAVPLAACLDPAPAGELAVDPDLAARYRGALDIVRGDDPAACTACFTSAYGRSPVKSGSYLATGDGALRRFSPAEILRLLGFPPSFEMPSSVPLGAAWRLVGNSLSVAAVRAVLTVIPELAR